MWKLINDTGVIVVVVVAPSVLAFIPGEDDGFDEDTAKTGTT